MIRIWILVGFVVLIVGCATSEQDQEYQAIQYENVHHALECEMYPGVC